VTRKKKILLGFVAALLLLVAIFYALTAGPPPSPILPKPNGYDDFIAAVRVAGSPLIYKTNGPMTDFAADIESNRHALDLARAGLGKKCQAIEPDDPRGTNWNTGAGLPVLAGFKSICGLLTEEARVAGETNAATAMGICVEDVRFAHEIARGGPVINHLVGFACQSIALREAARYVPRMSPAECVNAARAFRGIERDAATWDEVVAGERAWFDQRAGFRDKLFRFILRKSLDASISKAQSKLAASAAQLKAFIATLDAQAREKDAAPLPPAPGKLSP
jgi:hypothetical protein